ncbi:MAG: L,D-transpeptidase family protein [Myxococcota bacterium]|nr:L,D-transpeptidase family protein [Myxococcota bacterium]
MSTRTRVLVSLLAASLAILSACDRDTAKEDNARNTSAPSALEDDSLRRSGIAFIDAIPELLDASADARARASTPSLTTALEPGKKGALARLEVERAKLVRDLYASREFEPVWISPNGALTEQGKAWLEILSQAEPKHGIFGADVRYPAVQVRLERLEQPLLSSKSLTLEKAERERLLAWFDKNASNFDGPMANQEILEALLTDGEPLSTFAQTREEIVKDRSDRQRAILDAELLLTDAILRYAARMKVNNLAWERDRAWKPELDMPEGANEKTRARIEDARRDFLLADLITPVFASNKEVTPLLESLVPPFEQYQRLVGAHERYAKLHEQGGWAPLPATVIGLKNGDSKPEVRLIKERLRAEGFWGEEDSEAYGPKLTEAVKLYQYTHQVWEKGIITDETWRSMNVPIERRFWRVRQSLERWRNMRIGADKDYVYVNIPDFHTEVWEDGKREMRFKVVTGSARREWDTKTGEVSMPRATELFSDEMEYIVFNPYWNVPKGITESEILPKLEENPNYLEENNYEWHETSVGNRILRQTPGVHNALGLVKFLFPNKHDIYLHDTNEKGYFRYPIRAFSHGCMRVHEPMQLAEYLLKREGKWDEKRGIDKWLQGGGETWIKLENPLPVHIEYVVVRVDDEGHTHFLADVYKLDHEPMTRMTAADKAFRVRKLARQLTSKTIAEKPRL